MQDVQREEKEYEKLVEIIQKKVQNIEEYCHTFNDWPRSTYYGKINKVTDGTTGQQLYSWLYRSGFSKNEYRYLDIACENGKRTLDVLNELYEEYGKVKRKTRYDVEGKVIWVKFIQEYCSIYKTWPVCNVKTKNQKIRNGITCEQIASWLYRSGYSTNTFIYMDYVDENGILLKDILDDLYNKYCVNNNEFVDLSVIDVNVSNIIFNLYYKFIALETYYNNNRFLEYNNLLKNILDFINKYKLDINVNKVLSMFDLDNMEKIKYANNEYCNAIMRENKHELELYKLFRYYYKEMLETVIKSR